MSCATTTVSHPAWPIGYDEMEPYYTEAEQLYQVHGARGRGPDRARRQRAPTPSRRCRTSRASSSSPTTSKPSATSPSTRRAGDAPRARHGPQRLRPLRTCDGFPCLVHAGSDAEGARGSPGARVPERHSVGETPRRWRSTPTRAAAPLPRSWSNARAPARRSTRTSWLVSCGAASSSAKLLLASATERHPNGLSNRSISSGATTRSTTARRSLALRRTNPTVFQKTLGLNDFYFRSDDFEYSARQHPDGRQVTGRHVSGRSRSRPSWRRRGRWRSMARRAVDFDSRPRTSRDRRTA